MPWARIDDGFLSHHKTERISLRALGYWLQGLLYAARNLTDGKLPKSFVRTKSQVAMCDDLVRRGLWKKTDEGWLIHDYLEWNDSKAETERRRREGRKRQAEWRDRHVVSDKSVTIKDRYGTEGLSSLPTPNGEKRPSSYVYPEPSSPEPLPELTPEQRAENIRRAAEMAREAAAKMGMSQ